MPTKRVVIIGVLLLLLVIGGLWYVGQQSTTSKASSTLNLAYQQEGVDLSASSTLKSFDTDQAFLNSFSTSARAVLDQPLEDIKAKVETELAQNKKLRQLSQMDLSVVHTVSELKYSNNESTSTLRAYGLRLATILAPYNTQRPNEVATVLQLMDSKKTESLDSLRASRSMQAKVKDNLLTLPVPKSASLVIIGAINSLEKSIALLKLMENVVAQPVPALQAGLLYFETEKDFAQKLVAINRYFLDRQVLFSTEETQNIYLNLPQ